MSGEVMGERKRRILQAITDDYISTGEPVGSRTIARRYNLGISPATIRNEMADLEENGYLKQPHTSAGRIPSDKGYRFYVDSLMTTRKLSRLEKNRIQARLEKCRREIDALIQQAALVMAELTSYTALVLTPRFHNAIFKHLELVPLNNQSILLLLVTGPGFVETRVVETPQPISAEEAERLAGFLNSRLVGRSLSDIGPDLFREFESELAHYRSLLDAALELLTSSLKGRPGERIYTEGTMNILGQPEFRDIERIKPLFSVLSRGDTLMTLMDTIAAGGPTEVIIGQENPLDEMRECSVVGAAYGISGQIVGVIGLLGPTRMDYARATGFVEFLAGMLTEFLTRLDIR